jgi:hypothetical protein
MEETTNHVKYFMDMSTGKFDMHTISPISDIHRWGKSGEK